MNTIKETYLAAKKETHSTAMATKAIMKAHGLDAGTAADLCWRIETGKAMPAMIDDEGNQTDASKFWDRGAEKALTGE